MLKLVMITGPNKGRHVRVSDNAPVTVGRDKGRLRLLDSRVSKHHAEIAFDGESWILRDLGSSNGTFLNQNPLRGLAELERGDVVQFGRIALRVRQADASDVRDVAGGMITLSDETLDTPVRTQPLSVTPIPDDDDDDALLAAAVAADEIPPAAQAPAEADTPSDELDLDALFEEADRDEGLYGESEDDEDDGLIEAPTPIDELPPLEAVPAPALPAESVTPPDVVELDDEAIAQIDADASSGESGGMMVESGVYVPTPGKAGWQLDDGGESDALLDAEVAPEPTASDEDEAANEAETEAVAEAETEVEDAIDSRFLPDFMVDEDDAAATDEDTADASISSATAEAAVEETEATQDDDESAAASETQDEAGDDEDDDAMPGDTADRVLIDDDLPNGDKSLDTTHVLPSETLAAAAGGDRSAALAGESGPIDDYEDDAIGLADDEPCPSVFDRATDDKPKPTPIDEAADTNLDLIRIGEDDGPVPPATETPTAEASSLHEADVLPMPEGLADVEPDEAQETELTAREPAATEPAIEETPAASLAFDEPEPVEPFAEPEVAEAGAEAANAELTSEPFAEPEFIDDADSQRADASAIDPIDAQPADETEPDAETSTPEDTAHGYKAAASTVGLDDDSFDALFGDESGPPVDANSDAEANPGSAADLDALRDALAELEIDDVAGVASDGLDDEMASPAPDTDAIAGPDDVVATDADAEADTVPEAGLSHAAEDEPDAFAHTAEQADPPNDSSEPAQDADDPSVHGFSQPPAPIDDDADHERIDDIDTTAQSELDPAATDYDAPLPASFGSNAGSASAVGRELDSDPEVEHAAVVEAVVGDTTDDGPRPIQPTGDANPTTVLPPSEPRSSYRSAAVPDRSNTPLKKLGIAAAILLALGAGAALYFGVIAPNQIAGNNTNPETNPETAGNTPTDPTTPGSTLTPPPNNPGTHPPIDNNPRNPETPTGRTPDVLAGVAPTPNPFDNSARVLGSEALAGRTTDDPNVTLPNTPSDDTTPDNTDAGTINLPPLIIPNPGNPDTTGNPATFPATGPSITPGTLPNRNPDNTPDVAGTDNTDNATDPTAPIDGDRLVFLVDCSGSLVDSLPQMLLWLHDAIATLQPGERFTIIFFKKDQAIEPSPAGLKPLTRSYLQDLDREWLNPNASPILPAGRSDPAAAFELALSYEPSDIYLLSDESFAQRAGDTTPVEAADFITQTLGDADVRLHGVQFFYDSGDSTLQALSEQFGGSYEFVEETRHPDRDPIDLLEELENRNP